jgi:broad specificity phosphatase PhoE
MKLFFVRHAQSIGNLTSDFSTSDHDRLSPLGLEQARAVVPRLKALGPVDRIYCSPALRAIQTILPYLTANDLKAEIWPELDEACWQQDKLAPVPERESPAPLFTLDPSFQPLFSVRQDRPWLPYGDEVFREGLNRIDGVFRELLKRHLDSRETLLVAGHALFATHLLGLFLGQELSPVFRYDHENTGISLIALDRGGTFFARYLNRV